MYEQTTSSIPFSYMQKNCRSRSRAAALRTEESEEWQEENGRAGGAGEDKDCEGAMIAVGKESYQHL